MRSDLYTAPPRDTVRPQMQTPDNLSSQVQRVIPPWVTLSLIRDVAIASWKSRRSPLMTADNNITPSLKSSRFWEFFSIGVYWGVECRGGDVARGRQFQNGGLRAIVIPITTARRQQDGQRGSRRLPAFRAGFCPWRSRVRTLNGLLFFGALPLVRLRFPSFTHEHLII